MFGIIVHINPKLITGFIFIKDHNQSKSILVFNFNYKDTVLGLSNTCIGNLNL